MSAHGLESILMTADTIGGVWTYAVELARALEPHVPRIALATMGDPVSDQQRAELAALPHVILFESRFRLEWMDDPWQDVDRAGGWLLEVAETVQPDLVHLNGYAHGALPWNAPVLMVAHSCVLSWWQAVKKTEAPPCYDEYHRRVGAGLAAADLVVAPTAEMLAAVEDLYGTIQHREVIPNGRDARQFAPAEKQPWVLSAGRLWDGAKNVAALVAAAPGVRWPIRLAGDCRHPNGSGSREEPVGVCYLGRLDPAAMARELAVSAIYALPARYEPFGLSALEAGLSGCALVLGDIPSLREVWGDAAVFVDPDDPAALARAINGLIEDDRLREEMSRRARRRAAEFGPQAMAGNYLRAYGNCVSRREAVPA